MPVTDQDRATAKTLAEDAVTHEDGLNHLALLVAELRRHRQEATVPVVNSDTSDGFHTFDELYEQRTALFAALARSHDGIAWRTRRHHPDDPDMFEGYFLAGIDAPIGTITYHCRLDTWDWFAGVPVVEHADRFDGHTPHDVRDRLIAWNVHTLTEVTPPFADLFDGKVWAEHDYRGTALNLARRVALDTDDARTHVDVAVRFESFLRAATDPSAAATSIQWAIESRDDSGDLLSIIEAAAIFLAYLTATEPLDVTIAGVL